MKTFLSVETLKARGLVEQNVDVKTIVTIIEEIQDHEIHTILGTALYEDIKSTISGGTSSNASYRTLIDDYITPCMIRYVEAELVVLNSYKLGTKGTQVKNSDNNQPATMREMLSLADNRSNKAETYAQRITDFLLANLTTYPKYSTQTRTDAIYPNKTSYDSGIYLGDDCEDCPTPREEKWKERS